MTTKILDRSKPFGVVVGSSDGTIHHQDGACFGSDDREIGAPAATPAATPAAAPSAPAVEGAVTLEDLQGLHVSQIKKLVLNAGMELITGKGSKANNIEQLLAG